MASIRRVGKRWRAEVCCRGVRKSRVFASKMRARAWADEQEVSIRDGIIDTSATLADAIDKYAAEVSPKHKGERHEVLRLAAIKRLRMADKRIMDVTPADIAAWRDMRLQAVTGASVRREMGLLKSVFRVARDEWRWILKSPMDTVKRPPAAESRDRILTASEVDMLSAALTEPYRGIFLLALETGMRLGEICGIRPADVHGKYCVLRNTKNGTSRQVPLSTKARELLRSAPFQTTPANASAVFYKTRKSLGIDCRFHDTRHTALTRLAQILSPLELARMLGMKDTKTLMIYYNEPAESIADKLG